MQTSVALSSQVSTELCLHCNSPVIAAGDRFCCPGCEFVHHSIQGLGLGAYYRLLKSSDSAATPARVTPQKFEYCDDPRFIESFTKELVEGVREIKFFLEGVHCAACVWLLEKLPEVEPGVKDSRLEFSKGELSVRYNSALVSPARIAGLLNSFGYKPTPIRSASGDVARKASNRLFLVRIGVAAVCTMNIMMMAVSLYQGDISGIETPFRALFTWVSFFLAIPVVCFSAIPFYRTAFGGFKSGVLHIDLPISLAVVAGFLLSAANTILNRPGIYFDSVTALVLLLLIGRWVQHRIVERASDAHNLLYAISPRVAHVAGKEVFVESLKAGDVVDVTVNEVVPVDGTIVAGEGLVNSAILSGESKPLRRVSGDVVFAGTKLVSGNFSVRISSLGQDTRLGKIMETVEKASLRRAPLETFLDRCSRRFTATVVILAIFTFLWWVQTDSRAAVENAIALLVVTCPCVLAFSTPITFSLAITRAARRGILFRSAEAVERVTQVENVVFDKTGTLTSGNPQVEELWVCSENSTSFQQVSQQQFLNIHAHIAGVCRSLEEGIEHPVADGIRAYCASVDSVPSIVNREFLPGVGVAGQLDSVSWALRRPPESLVSPVNPSLSSVLLSKDNKPIAIFGIGDTPRPEAASVLSFLGRRGKTNFLLSGDTTSVALAVSKRVGIQEQNVIAEASPERKVEFVAALQGKLPTMMVGDGVNDAAAFKVASVGVGFHGGAEAALKVADVYLAEQDLNLLMTLFEGTGATLRTIKRNLCFSATYNLLGGLAAMLGYIGPLGAAILMPISSLTVVSAAILSRSFRK